MNSPTAGLAAWLGAACIVAASLATQAGAAEQQLGMSGMAFGNRGAALPAAPKAARGTPKQAKALLDRAVAFLDRNPPARAFAAFNNQKGRFIENDLYVFVVDVDGISHANGAEPEGLVGLNVLELRDVAGKPFIREMISVAQKQQAGTVEYLWLNRITNRIEPKTAMVKLVGRHVVGVGHYSPRASAEQAQAFLDSAIEALRKVGPDAAFAAFNDPNGQFVRDDLYVFALGLDDAKFRAMGASPSLVGTIATDLRDAAGKPIVQEMIALAREKGEGAYQYVWRNPATNKVETKRSFVKRADGYLVGVGYYEPR